MEVESSDLILEVKPKISFNKFAIDPIPEKAVSDYFQTKLEKNFLFKKKPEWDASRISPAAELLAAKREILSAEKNLEWRREEQRVRSEEMDKEWDTLLTKKCSLKQAIIKFNSFFKENNEKLERVKRKISEEKEFQKSKNKEIEELQDKVNYMKSIKDEIEKYVKEYRMYENFLQQVIALSSEMNTPPDILNRYETLASAGIELAARQERTLSALEIGQTEMIKLMEEKSQIMLGLKTALAQLQIRYDRAKTMSFLWKTALTRHKNISAEKASELDKVKTSCWNLYMAMCARKGIEVTVDPDDVEEQLVFIKRSIQESKRILRLVQKKAAKEGHSIKHRFSGHSEQSTLFLCKY